MKPTNKTYEIRTLADIYNLPSYEAVEACLKEISVLILQTRATNDLLANAAKNMGLPTDAICIPFLEKVEWIDDGKGIVDVTYVVEGMGDALLQTKTQLNTKE